MLDAIISASLRNRFAVLIFAFVVAGFGLFRAAGTPIDVLPDLNRPIVTVMSEAHGMVPEDVERLVTWPIEQVMNGATGVFRVRSSSGRGLSVVNVEFEWGTDIYLDRQIVAERLQLATPNLPEGVLPVMAPISSIMGQVQLVGFRSRAPDLDVVALRRLVDREVVPRLRALSGVAQIVAIGGQPTELQIDVDADKLRSFEVTLDEVAAAVEAANVAVAGGLVELGARAPQVSVDGLLVDGEELASAVVRAHPTRPVRISDVANVTLGPATVRTGDAGIDAGPGVIVVVSKQPSVDTVELTERVDGELQRLSAELPAGVEILPGLFRQADFIDRAIDNVLTAVRDGAALVIVILFLFLLNVRTTLITLTAIPLSVAVACLVFAALGLSINTMTLGGLAVAIGTLVDDAIVDVENVYRRLHENAQRSVRRPVMDVLFHASSEIRRPVLYGTLLVTVVYLPLFFLSGIEGRLFAPIGIAYITSVVASLLIALTVTPVLCSYLLPRVGGAGGDYGSRLVGWIRAGAERAVRFSVAYTEVVLVGAVLVACAAAALLSQRGSEFLPPFQEGTAQVNLYLPPDTSLERSSAAARRLEHAVLEVEGVRSVARRTGRAAGDEHAEPVSVTEAIVSFDPESTRSRSEILEDIREHVAEAVPGVSTETEQPLAHLLSHMLSGVTAQVAILIYGPDLAELRDLASRVEHAVERVDGVRDLLIEPQVLVDQVEVRPRRRELSLRGLTVADVADLVELAMGGEQISRLQVGSIAYPIVVRLSESDRASLSQLSGLLLRDADGNFVRLGDVADVALTATPNNIKRENVQRRIVVQHNVGGRSLGEVVADVERALAPIRAALAERPGYALRIRGQFEAQQAATRTMITLSIVAIALMVLILFFHFRSLGLAMLVLATRPLALVGGALFVWSTDQALSVATLVGFIALLGMAARNAILLVDHYLHLMREEQEDFTLEMVVRAGRERVVPVLMTALTSGIGLVPLALAPDQPGRELLYPVATVVLGGLVTNTLLDFFVLPGLFFRTCRNVALRAVSRTPTD